MQEIPTEVRALVERIPLFEKASDLHVAPLQDVISLNNVNVRVDAGGKTYLVRIGADTAHFVGIDRGEEIAAAQAAARAGVAPEILYAESNGCIVMPFITGRHWKPEEFHEPSKMARLAAVLRRLHSVRVAKTGTSIYARVQRLLANARLLCAELPPSLDAHSETIQRIAQEQSEDGSNTTSLTHGDFWANNFLDDGQRLWLVDWEFAGVGSGLYDLATISMAGGYSDAEQQTLLDLYGYTAPNALDNLRQMRWIARFFEGTWALVQHGLIVTGRRGSSDFDYLNYANRMFTALDENR